MGTILRENLLAILVISCFSQYITPPISASFADYDAYIVNGLPNNNEIFRVHIFSGDDDLQYHTLKVGESFHWHFKVGFGTKYYGHFWWGDHKERGFAVVDRKLLPYCRRSENRLPNVCWWLVKEDGFFLASKVNPEPKDLVKMNDWLSKTTI